MEGGGVTVDGIGFMPTFHLYLFMIISIRWNIKSIRMKYHWVIYISGFLLSNTLKMFSPGGIPLRNRRLTREKNFLVKAFTVAQFTMRVENHTL